MLFRCKNCGRDTLTQPHAINCPVLKEQSERKAAELGIGFKPDQFQLPLRLGET